MHLRRKRTGWLTSECILLKAWMVKLKWQTLGIVLRSRWTTRREGPWSVPRIGWPQKLSPGKSIFAPSKTYWFPRFCNCCLRDYAYLQIILKNISSSISYFAQKEVQLQGRHMEPGHHSDRNDRRGATLLEWNPCQSPLPHRSQRKAEDHERRSAEQLRFYWKCIANLALAIRGSYFCLLSHLINCLIQLIISSSFLYCFSLL